MVRLLAHYVFGHQETIMSDNIEASIVTSLDKFTQKRSIFINKHFKMSCVGFSIKVRH